MRNIETKVLLLVLVLIGLGTKLFVSSRTAWPQEKSPIRSQPSFGESAKSGEHISDLPISVDGVTTTMTTLQTQSLLHLPLDPNCAADHAANTYVDYNHQHVAIVLGARAHVGRTSVTVGTVERELLRKLGNPDVRADSSLYTRYIYNFRSGHLDFIVAHQKVKSITEIAPDIEW